jgi:hypothetical protein
MRFSLVIADMVRETVSRVVPMVSAITLWAGLTSTTQPPPACRPRAFATSRK